VTQELRQFETIFVEPRAADASVVDARIFTVEEELPFAGHPLIGAAAALHERIDPAAAERRWTFEIAGRRIQATSSRTTSYYAATMHQGPATLVHTVDESQRAELAAAFGLATDDVLPLPLQVVSTGLPYLIVPVTPAALERAHVAVDDLETRLARIGAAFAYVLDPATPEGRSWNNAGTLEDIATGSAAGPVLAYLDTRAVALRQGRFLGRPSVIRAERRDDGDIAVSGAVAPVALGTLD
jgi:PhzF family phenazine biosynthesis protein